MPRLTDITGNWFPDPILLSDITHGGISSVKTVGKYGSNDAVGTGAYEDIWKYTTDLSYLTSAETLSIVSGTANDDKDSGTGARAITVQGLDNDWNEIEEYILLEGLSPVTTQKSYLRVNRAFVEEVGNVGTNDGLITMTASTAGTVQGVIAAGEGQTQQTHYSVPAGRTGYISKIWVNIGKGDDATVRLQTRNGAGTKGWKIKRELKLFEATLDQPLQSYIKVEAKSDIRYQGQAGLASAKISAGYDLYLTGR